MNSCAKHAECSVRNTTGESGHGWETVLNVPYGTLCEIFLGLEEEGLRDAKMFLAEHWSRPSGRHRFDCNDEKCSVRDTVDNSSAPL